MNVTYAEALKGKGVRHPTTGSRAGTIPCEGKRIPPVGDEQPPEGEQNKPEGKSAKSIPPAGDEQPPEGEQTMPEGEGAKSIPHEEEQIKPGETKTEDTEETDPKERASQSPDEGQSKDEGGSVVSNIRRLSLKDTEKERKKKILIKEGGKKIIPLSKRLKQVKERDPLKHLLEEFTKAARNWEKGKERIQQAAEWMFNRPIKMENNKKWRKKTKEGELNEATIWLNRMF